MTIDWPPLIPFDCHNLPAFPVDALPGIFRDYAKALADTHQVPVDLPASVMLAVGGIPLANRVNVAITNDWREPCHLFTLVALPSGHGKSPVFSKLIAPLRDYEKTVNERLRHKIEENASTRRILEEKVRRIEQKAVKAQPEELDDIRASASKIRSEMPPPLYPVQLIAIDVTQEKLVTLMAQNSGRMALLSPEGDIFELMAGRYNNGSPNLEVFLKGYSGDMLRVDRQGRGSDFVERPALTLGLAVQPEVLHGLADKPGFRGKGLLARILFSLPPTLFGQRDMSLKSIDPVIRSRYEKHISHQLHSLERSTPRNGEELHAIQLSDNAKRLFISHRSSVERDMRDGGRFQYMRDWTGKLPGQVIRIAGILHAAEYPVRPWETPLSRDTLDQAITIGEYYIEHALAAFEQMGADPATEAGRHVLEWLVRTGTTEFSARQAHQALRGRYKRAHELAPAYAVLQERGYIVDLTALQAPHRRRVGRPGSTRYAVNPQVHA